MDRHSLSPVGWRLDHYHGRNNYSGFQRLGSHVQLLPQPPASPPSHAPRVDTVVRSDMSNNSFPRNGRLPGGWKWANLSSIALINPPRRRDIPYAPNTPVTFVPMQSVSQDTGTVAWPEMRPLAGVSKGYTYFEEGDVLFAKITPCMQNGKHAIAYDLANGFGFGTTEFHVVRPGETVTADWIHRFLRQPYVLKEAARHFQGAVGQQRVPKQFLIDLPVPLPPLAEQKRIVSVLNDQFAAVERAKKAAEERLEAALALGEALLRIVWPVPDTQLIQDWTWNKLGDLCTPIKNIDPRKYPDAQFTYIDISSIDRSTKTVTSPTVLSGSAAPSRAKASRPSGNGQLVLEGRSHR